MLDGKRLLRWNATQADWLNARTLGIGASEIAVVLGLSPYGSPFDLFWRKVETEVDRYDSEAMYWGRELEEVVARRFGNDHKEFTLRHTGLWQSRARSWQLASPDRLLCEGRGTTPVALWEGKTSASWDGWGDGGTDHIPVAYRAQVLQQMDVVGVDVVYVSVLVAGRSYREYVVERDDRDIEVMRHAGDEFWRRVAIARNTLGSAERYAPPVDGHTATTARLRRLHPSVDDTAVEVPPDLITGRQQAFADRAEAQERMNHCDNRLRQLMGDARYAEVEGRRVATRSVTDTRVLDTKRLRLDHPDLLSGYETTEPRHRLLVPNPKRKEAIA